MYTDQEINGMPISGEEIATFAKKLSPTTEYKNGYIPYEGERFEWEMPCATEHPICEPLKEEALYRSNHRVIGDDFKEENPETATVGNFIVFIDKDDSNALARALYWERAMSEYPVANEDDLSYLEMELIEEAYNDFGKRDTIEALLEAGNPLNLVDPETEEPNPEIEAADSYIFQVFESAVQYTGEAYVDADTIEDGLEDVRYEIKADFERAQPPLVGTDESS